MASRARETVGQYEILSSLASGGMGTVYLARKGGVHGFERLVAIKRLHEHLRKEQDFVRMFLDEARLAARIHHPHVVPITEVGEDASGYYLVMDYVAGCNAHTLINVAAERRMHLPIPVTLRVVLDALSGLAAAHDLVDEKGRSLEIVHRDVSPQNILVGLDGLSRLTDFGVARAASRLYHSSRGEVKGKTAYMAPEQITAKPLDPRADLFAMGIILWEMLASRPLFHGANDAETIDRLLYKPTPKLTEAFADAPPALTDICAKALARERQDRFANANAMIDAIEAAAKPLGGAASHREVAKLVDELVGSAVRETKVRIVRESVVEPPPPTEQQPKSALPGAPAPVAEAVDAALASTIPRLPEPAPKKFPTATIVTGPPVMTVPPSGSERSLRSLAGVALGIAIAGVIAGGGAWALKRRARVARPDLVTAVPAETVVSTSTSTSTSASAAAEPDPPASVIEPATAAADPSPAPTPSASEHRPSTRTPQERRAAHAPPPASASGGFNAGFGGRL